MSYDEPPEPTEEEMDIYDQEQALKRATAVRIEGLNAEVVEVIVRQVVRDSFDLEKLAHQELNKQLKEQVSKVLDAALRERIAATVDAAIADGIPSFDTYSGAEKGRASVAEIVAKQLAQKTNRNGYSSSDGTTLAEQAVHKAVAEVFENAMKGELAKVVADFKKQADAVFQAKLVAGLKEAIGLRS